MTPERTPEGMWVLYQATTGTRVLRWPVDGRGLLETGAYTADPTNGDHRHTAPVAPGSETPASLPTLHSEGVPLVVATAGTPATFAPAPTPTPSRKRR